MKLGDRLLLTAFLLLLNLCLSLGYLYLAARVVKLSWGV